MSKGCLVCGLQSFPVKKVGGCAILKCSGCGLEFADPMPSPAALRHFYSGYRDFHAPNRVVTANASKNVKLLAKHGLTRGSRLLDYGCGKNLFAAQGFPANWKGYDPHNGNCDRSVLRGSFDFVTLWGVLEHLADPVVEVRRLASRLVPNGRLALTTVWVESGVPYRHKPPEHLTYWTEDALCRLLRRCGLEAVKFQPYFMHQDADIYLRCVFDAAKMPDPVREHVRWGGGETVTVPTNEVLVVGRKLKWSA